MTQREWLGLPAQIRDKYKKLFGLFPTGTTEVIDNRVVSDGISDLQLSAITEAQWAEARGDKPLSAEQEIDRLKTEAGEPVPTATIRDLKPVKPKVKKAKK